MTAAAHETEPSKKAPNVKIASIQLSDSNTILPPPSGVTAIVGGNNVGKSTLLAQLTAWLPSGPAQHRPAGQYYILQDVKFSVGDDANKLYQWIARNSSYQRATRADPNAVEGHVRVGTGVLTKRDVEEQIGTIESGYHALGPLTPFLTYSAGPGGRSATGFSAPHRPRPGMPPSHHIHHLEDNDQLRKQVESLYKEIFGQKITLDKIGTESTIRIGEPPKGLEDLKYYNDAERAFQIREELDQLSLLDDQGDGVKSLMGLLLPIVTATYSIVIVDEPEAFLHPPQAVKLGKLLGQLAKDLEIQIILATHDRNILIGLLESGVDLSIARLTRDNDKTRSYQLDASKIAKIWADPVLRYSNVLDGLFHSLVVIAENERDCTFYAAALDAASEQEPLRIPPSEVLFVPTGGKDGIAPVVEALAQIKVPVAASPDIDILNEPSKIRRLIESFDGKWEDYAEDYRVCTAELNQKREAIPASTVLEQVVEFLVELNEEDPERLWDDELRDKFRARTRSQGSRWEQVKKHGINEFPGAVISRLHSLLERLEKIGLVPVRVGELESFANGYPVVARKGLNWLRQALEANVHKSPSAIEHVKRLLNANSHLASLPPDADAAPE
jgi:predicted ATPase